MALSCRPRPLSSVYSCTARPSGISPNCRRDTLGAGTTAFTLTPVSGPDSADEDSLSPAHGTVIGREKQRHARDVLRQQRSSQTLPARDVLAAGSVHAYAALLICHHPARHDRIHTDVER